MLTFHRHLHIFSGFLFIFGLFFFRRSLFTKSASDNHLVVVLMFITHKNMNTTAGSSIPPTLVDEDVRRRCYLTRFAFLLSSARSEYDNEPVVGCHHDKEMSSFFSRRHLILAASAGAGAVGVGERIMPPCISSSSLSLSSERDGVDGVSGMMMQPSSRDDVQDEGSSSKRTLLDAAALNMSAPFFTTPDTASSTATTVLKNLGEFIYYSRDWFTICVRVVKVYVLCGMFLRHMST
jgi:hypothetical protein